MAIIAAKTNNRDLYMTPSLIMKLSSGDYITIYHRFALANSSLLDAGC
jgi:hypothetical protein